MNKTVFAFIDIDERGLDAMEDIGDFPLIDITGKLSFFFSFDDQIDQLAVVKRGKSNLFRFDIQ